MAPPVKLTPEKLKEIETRFATETYHSREDLARRCSISVPTLRKGLEQLNLLDTQPPHLERKKRQYVSLEKEEQREEVVRRRNKGETMASIANSLRISRQALYKKFKDQLPKKKRRGKGCQALR